jgi:response regulator of citrate/malate metabolism
LAAAELIPLLKQCNRNVTIILVSNEESPPAIRKIRNEGIFYHALKPVKPEDTEEIRQAVKCAFENISHHVH